MTPALELRERLVASFLASSRTLLVAHDDRQAVLRLGSGELLALVTETAPAALSPTLESLRARGGHVVVVGGSSELRSALHSTVEVRGVSLHHVADDWSLARIRGKEHWRIDGAVADAAAKAPLDAEAIAAHLAAGVARHQEETRLADALAGRFPWVTLVIGAACVLLFALGQWWGPGATFDLVLLRSGANSNTHVTAGEVWRVLSSAFLHANVEHLIVNMLALASFGVFLEKLLGARRFIVLYTLAALGGGLASALLRDGGLSVGASGAIWGLMTAGIGIALRPRGLLPPLSLARARRAATFPLIVNVLYSLMPGIDLLGHLGGGVVGFALSATGVITVGLRPAWSETPEPAPRRSTALSAAAVVLAGVLFGSVGVALANGRPWEVNDAPVLRRVEVADTGISLELPDGIARAVPVTERKGGAQTFVYGTLLDQPLVAEIVTERPAQLPPVEELLAEVKQSVTRGTAEIVSLGDRRALYVHDQQEEVTSKAWFFVAGDRLCLVRLHARRERPASWAGVEERIAASVRPW